MAKNKKDNIFKTSFLERVEMSFRTICKVLTDDSVVAVKVVRAEEIRQEIISILEATDRPPDDMLN